MEVITTILLCTVGLLIYLVNANSTEVQRLKNLIREREYEVKYLLDEKETEISNLQRQVQTEKNKLLQSPSKNLDETLELKRELNDKQNEIYNLQRNLHEKEKIISDLRNINSSLNLKSENEIQNLRRQISSVQNNSNEIYLLKNQLDKKENDIKTLNQILSSIKNENEELKSEIKNLKIELEIYKRNHVTQGELFTPDQGILFTPDTDNNSKRFVQVIFPGYSQDRYDYLLGNHRNIKIGDFVMVGTKKGARRAKVVYVSDKEEFSSRAKSEIIKKVN